MPLINMTNVNSSEKQQPHLLFLLLSIEKVLYSAVYSGALQLLVLPLQALPVHAHLA